MRSLENIKEALSYDVATGTFCWRVTVNARALAGSVAGSTVICGRAKKRYRTIAWGGTSYLAHRLAWWWMTGAPPSPDLEIDHEDGDGLNNAWRNLRLATRLQNMGNMAGHVGASSRFKGVARHSQRRNRWIVRISSRYVGCFDDEETAARAYDTAARARYGEFARLNFPTSPSLPRQPSPT